MGAGRWTWGEESLRQCVRAEETVVWGVRNDCPHVHTPHMHTHAAGAVYNTLHGNTCSSTYGVREGSRSPRRHWNVGSNMDMG